MFEGTIAYDLDQIRVLQQIAFLQDRKGDFNIVVGQFANDFGGHEIAFGKILRNGFANLHFGVSDQLVQNCLHERDFTFVQFVASALKQIGNRPDQRLSTDNRLLSGQFEQ